MSNTARCKVFITAYYILLHIIIYQEKVLQSKHSLLDRPMREQPTGMQAPGVQSDLHSPYTMHFLAFSEKSQSRVI